MRKYLYMISLGVATSVGWPATANAHMDHSSADAEPSDAAGATRQAEGDGAGLNDIVVTAQRRAENLQKSSLSISVISGEQIGRQGIVSTEDIAKLTPGVQIGTAGPIPQVYIRGVGDPGQTAVSNPAVALNIGGVYYARPQAAGTSFYDLERIEVLKGPQGTLYGRNASGGAINILPVKPELGHFGGVVNFDVGRFNMLSSDGAVNIPLGDRAAVRGSYLLRTRDGYLSDGSSDDVREAVRLQLFAEPSEAVSILLLGAYAHQGGVGNGFALYDPKGNPLASPPRPATARFDPWTSTTDPRGAAIAASRFPPPVLLPGDPANLYQDNDYWNLQGELNADIGFATLTFIPSYQYSKIDYAIYSPIPAQTRSDDGAGPPETSRAYSGEVRLANESDRLKWVLGAYYYDEKQKQRFSVNNGLIQNASLDTEIVSKSYALFGQATFSVSDSLRLIGGLRYSEDKRDIDGIRTSNAPVPGTNPLLIRGSSRSDSLNYKAGFEFDFASDSMIYGNYSTGYKAGGVSAAVAPAYEPERVKSVTFGMRNRFFDNNVQLNVEAFYLDYTNQHVQVVGPDDLGIISGLIRNAGEAKSYGVEADLVIRITSNDQFSANLVYNDAEYGEFTYRTPFAVLPAGQTGCAVSATGVVGPAGPVAQVDCSGKRLQRAPKWTGNLAYNHVFDLGGEGSLTLGGDMQFASGREATIDFIPNTKIPAYQVYNASLTYAPDTRLSVTAYVRNITNEAVYLGGVQSTFAPSFVGMSIAAPRTYGLRLSYRY